MNNRNRFLPTVSGTDLQSYDKPVSREQADAIVKAVVRRYGPIGRNDPAVGDYRAFPPPDAVGQFAPSLHHKITSAFFPDGGGRILSGTDYLQGGSLAAFNAALIGLSFNGDRRSTIQSGVAAGDTLVSTFSATTCPYSAGFLLRLGTVGTNNPNPFAGQTITVATSGFVPPLRQDIASTLSMRPADRSVRFTLESDGLGRALFVPWLTEQFQAVGAVIAATGTDNGQGVAAAGTVTVTLPTGLAANTTSQVELVTCDHEMLDDIARMFAALNRELNAADRGHGYSR